jgi:hypothetical protein
MFLIFDFCVSEIEFNEEGKVVENVLIFKFPEYEKEDDSPTCKTGSKNSEREPEYRISTLRL